MSNPYWKEPTEEEKSTNDIALDIIDLKLRLNNIQDSVNSILKAIVLVVFLIIGIGFAAIWTRPTCREGFIPTVIGYAGWSCVPGYKPEK